MNYLSHPGRSEIEADQLDKLNRLIGTIAGTNPFYSQRLKEAGLERGADSLSDFVDRCPFTTKAELTEDHKKNPPFGSNLTYPLERYTRYNQTSATTGSPMRWLDTPEDWDWMLGNWNRVFEAAGVDAGARVYFAFSFGPFLGFWTAFDAAAKRGCLCIPGGGLSSTARLQAILDIGVEAVCCTPTYAIRLAEVAEKERIDLSSSKVRKIVVAGEPGGSVPATRELIEAKWKPAKVFDHHGMTEVGPVSFEAPERPGSLRVIESSYFAEVIDPKSGKTIPPGEEGELVLTTLGRAGSPLLRYRTGDLVKPIFSEPGYRLDLEGGILGRTDDMVVIRGVNVYPSAVENLIRSFKEVAEYSVTIRESDSLNDLQVEVELSPRGPQPDSVKEAMEKAFRNTFNLRVPVTLAEAGSLPRYEMKANRWIRLKG
jgi:phenylacetate-CoA ligase